MTQEDEARWKRRAENERRARIEAEDLLSDRIRALYEAKRLLESTNRQLEAFSYSISHDLRAPLRHIDGFIDLIRETSASSLDEQAQRYLSIISESSRKMAGMIEDLLNFSRTGTMEISAVTIPLRPLVEEVLRDLDGQTRGRHVSWSVGELPEVRGHPALLRVVWVNLLSNALKFTRRRPVARIEVGADPRGLAEVVCHVRDNGVGFDPRYADKLFGVFQRLHRADDFEGSGIGLALVRRIVERHGGRTWAESAPDQGATFYFSLPKG